MKRRFQDAKWDLHSEARRSWCCDWSTRCALCPRRGAKMRPEFAEMKFFPSLTWHWTIFFLKLSIFLVHFFKVNLRWKIPLGSHSFPSFSRVFGGLIPGSEISSWAYRCQWCHGKLNDLAGWVLKFQWFQQNSERQLTQVPDPVGWNHNYPVPRNHRVES